MPESSRPRVLIVGAGFGGLSAAQSLARAPVDITVVDRRNFHLFQPLLYQVATAGLNPSDIAWPIRSILRDQANARVLLGEVCGVDLRARRVSLSDSGSLAYDYLVLATGATHNYFGNEQWSAHAPGLKRVDDATLIRRRLLMAFERAESSSDEAERRALLTFAVIGAGPTGVEMSGAIAELARRALAADFRSIDPRSARILLLEGGPRVLPALPEDLSAFAQRALERMGVEVRCGTLVTQVDALGLSTAQGRIDSRTVIWAAGIAASPAAHWLGAEADRAGRVRVQADLTLAGHPEVFVIGDTAAVSSPDGSAVPGIAPAAKQAGQFVAGVIRAAVEGRARPASFAYRHQGNLATIGRHAAVIDFGRVRLKGLLAWWIWGAAHIFFLIGLRNRVSVAWHWVYSYLSFGRGARLIVGSDAADEDRAP